MFAEIAAVVGVTEAQAVMMLNAVAARLTEFHAGVVTAETVAESMSSVMEMSRIAAASSVTALVEALGLM